MLRINSFPTDQLKHYLDCFIFDLKFVQSHKNALWGQLYQLWLYWRHHRLYWRHHLLSIIGCIETSSWLLLTYYVLINIFGSVLAFLSAPFFLLPLSHALCLKYHRGGWGGPNHSSWLLREEWMGVTVGVTTP